MGTPEDASIWLQFVASCVMYALCIFNISYWPYRTIKIVETGRLYWHVRDQKKDDLRYVTALNLERVGIHFFVYCLTKLPVDVMFNYTPSIVASQFNGHCAKYNLFSYACEIAAQKKCVLTMVFAAVLLARMVLPRKLKPSFSCLFHVAIKAFM